MLASIVLDEEILFPGTQLKVIRTTVLGAVGDSLADEDIRNRTGCTVVAAERNGSVVTNSGASFVIESEDELVVAGTDENISRFPDANRLMGFLPADDETSVRERSRVRRLELTVWLQVRCWTVL